MGPVIERIPHSLLDPNNPGHFIGVYQTKSTGRTPDDYLQRKCLKDFCYGEHSVSINDRDTIRIFCSKPLKDIDIRKDIRTRAAKEQRRQEEERTYKGIQWVALIECGNVAMLRVREHDLY